MDNANDPLITPLNVRLEEFAQILSQPDQKQPSIESFITQLSRYKECLGAHVFFAKLLLETDVIKQRELMLDFCKDPLAHFKKPETDEPNLPQLEAIRLEQKLPIELVDQKIKEQTWNEVKEKFTKYNKDIYQRYGSFIANWVESGFNMSEEEAKKAAETLQNSTNGATQKEIRESWTSQMQQLSGQKDGTRTATLVSRFMDETHLDTELVHMHAAAAATTEILLQNPDITRSGDVFESIASLHESPTQAAQRARVAAIVNNSPNLNTASIPANVARNLTNTIATNSIKAQKQLDAVTSDKGAIGEIVNRAGVKIAQSDVISRWSKQGITEQKRGIGNLVSGFTLGAQKIEEETKVYLEEILKKDPEHAMPSANELGMAHTYLANPSIAQWMFSWMVDKEKTTVVAAAVKTAADVVSKDTAKALGVQFLTSVGLGGLAQTALGGWVGGAIFGLSLVGKRIGGLFTGGVAGVGSAASGFAQGLLQTKPYKDPWTNIDIFSGVIVGVLLLVVLLSSWDIFHIRQNSYFQISNAGDASPVAQQPFNVSITATPGQLQNGVPASISYTVTTSALSGDQLTVSSAKVCFSIYGSSAKLQCQDISSSDLASGSYTFSVPIDQSFNNSIVAANVSVTGDTSTQSGITATGYTATIIGNPQTDVLIQGSSGVQPSGWCDKDGASIQWSSSDWAAMMGAVANLSQFGNYLNLVKLYNPGGITAYRINWTGNKTTGIYWGCTGTEVMYFYNGAPQNATYILAHEFGHAIAASPWFCEFKAQGIMSEGMTVYAQGQVNQVDEDFAESFAQYVIGDLKDLPKHYNFVEQVFGLIPAVHSQECAPTPVFSTPTP